MKKFIKICLIVAAVTCAIGLGTLISSIAMGATIYDLENAIERGDYSIVGSRILGYHDRDHFNTELEYADSEYSDYDDEYSYDTTISEGTYNDITKLDVRMTAGSFYIEESETDDIKVEITGPDSRKTTVTQNGKELKIFNDYKPPYDGVVILYCPENTTFKEVDIRVGGGESIISVPLEIHELDVEIGAGSFESTEHIKAKETDWDVGAGEIIISQLTSKKTDLECGAGTIQATFAGERTDYDYELECSVGEINIDDETYSGFGAEKKENNKANQKIEAKCSMGTISIDFDE